MFVLLLSVIVHGVWDRSTHGLEHASFASESISLVVGSVGDNSCVFAMDVSVTLALFHFAHEAQITRPGP